MKRARYLPATRPQREFLIAPIWSSRCCSQFAIALISQPRLPRSPAAAMTLAHQSAASSPTGSCHLCDLPSRSTPARSKRRIALIVRPTRRREVADRHEFAVLALGRYTLSVARGDGPPERQGLAPVPAA
jgi:hypothetical protein